MQGHQAIVWAAWRLAALLCGTQAAGHGEAALQTCDATPELTRYTMLHNYVAHRPCKHGSVSRRTLQARDAKQMAAGSVRVLATRAAAECDAARTGSKTWYAQLRSLHPANAVP